MGSLRCGIVLSSGRNRGTRNRIPKLPYIPTHSLICCATRPTKPSAGGKPIKKCAERLQHHGVLNDSPGLSTWCREGEGGKLDGKSSAITLPSQLQDGISLPMLPLPEQGCAWESLQHRSCWPSCPWLLELHSSLESLRISSPSGFSKAPSTKPARALVSAHLMGWCWAGHENKLSCMSFPLETLGSLWGHPASRG